MVVERVEKTDEFVKLVKKIKNQALKKRVQKQIARVIEHPEVGKPMMFIRKGTREVYVPPFRLAYAYLKERDTIIFLKLYHKDEQ